MKQLVLLAVMLALALSSVGTRADYLADYLGAAPRAGDGWSYSVIADGLDSVDNVAVGQAGEIYVSSEVGAAKGAVLQLTDGAPLVLLDDVTRPDGLALGPGVLFVTEETDNGRVLEVRLDDRSHRVVTVLDYPEGIERMANGSLVVAEDLRPGRVVRVAANGEIETLRPDLDRPEGVSIDRDNAIVVAETGSGRVLRIADGALTVIVEGLNEPDQVFCAPDGAIWISEDARPGRLLRYRDGTLEEVASGLLAPQGITYDAAHDRYLVAEQGRGRLLAFVRKTR
jgi:sugar lactone lactonase YvrE